MTTVLEKPTQTAENLGWKQQIDQLDLERLKTRLMHEIKGQGWSLERAEEAERWYKRFMLLWAKYPEERVVPSGDIDEIWHCHILDTRQYAKDCQRIFGRFIHHHPSFGPGSSQEIADHRRAIVRTKELFQEEFGEFPTQYAADCSCSEVGTACF